MDIRRSGCRILFVGLGCPKQERWMAAHRGVLPVIMLGVGAAFDFLSGQKPQAYPWMQRLGLEWAFRLATEPRRLWFPILLSEPRFGGAHRVATLPGCLARSATIGANGSGES